MSNDAVGAGQTTVAAEEAPASPAQRALWLLERYRGGNGLMSVPILLRLRGPLDVAALEAALGATVAHHEALRTTVELRRRAFVQIVHPAGELPVVVERALDGPVDFPAAYDQVRAMLQDDPDPRVAPYRARLWQTGADDHVLAVNIHHLATDAWSNRLVLTALGAAYSAIVAGRPVELPPVGLRYADHARAIAAGQQPGDSEADKAYWERCLSGATFARLPPRPDGRPVEPVFRTRRSRPPTTNESFELGPDTVAALRAFGRAQRTSLFVALLSAYLTALASLTGQDELALGSILANRARPQTHATVGFFANLMVLRAPVGPDPLVALSALRRQVLEALAHQDLHHGTLPLGTSGEVASGRVEDVVFHMLAQPPGTAAPGPLFAGLEHTELPLPDRLASRFDLELLVTPRGEGLAAVFRYTADRFERDWVRELGDRLLAVAERMRA